MKQLRIRPNHRAALDAAMGINFDFLGCGRGASERERYA